MIEINFFDELKKFKKISLEKVTEIENSDFSGIEESLKREIKRGNLILYEKIDKLETEIKSLNLENEKLKKDLFREKKEKQDFLNTIFQILDTQLSIDNIINEELSKEKQEKFKLTKKKIKGILNYISVEETAKIGERFNHIYHECINSYNQEKEEYIIKEIVTQGYIRDGKVIRVAKVVIE
ncbi:nucleotide exchange factor GrpE [Fusobacterium polymorphum]|uniref:Nucleotide exchange factor GrpE n=1 Tax=Fusobacterium nucleatum subsp. polymorphum TaxID=76857 RepID=A0A2C6CIS6_FUSNP|nr:nucleotide exchange factor GrpE [Fusobacterium polymorphum]